MPLVPLACAWLAGVLVAALAPGLTPDGARIALGTALLTLGPLVLLWQDRRTRWLALSLVACWLGLARGLLALPSPVPPTGSLRALNVAEADAQSAGAPHVHVRGVLLGDPDPVRAGRASQVRVAAESALVDGGWQSVHGTLLVVAAPFLAAGQGDFVEAAGVVQDPPAVPGFDYALWLVRHGVESYMDHADLRVLIPAAPDPGNLLGRWRRDAGLRTAMLLPEPEAGLLRGIVLGQRKAANASMEQDLVGSGTSWIVVVSGFHFTILLGFILLALRPVLSLRLCLAIAAVLALAYAIFVGLGVPVARAAVVGLLYLGGRALGRPVTAVNLLAIAALLLTALDPLVVTDAGFQLSFASVVGIMLLAPPLIKRWRRLPVLGEAFAVAVAVELAIWPLLVLQFGEVALISIPAGVLGSLLLGPIILLGSLLEVTAWLWLPLAQPLAWICWLPLKLLAESVHAAAQMPLAFTVFPASLLPIAVLWYALLAVVYIRSAPEQWQAVRDFLQTP